MMKIILSVSNTKGKNIVFISYNLQIYSLNKAVELAKSKGLENIYVVHRTSGDYLRTNKNIPKENSLDYLSISLSKFVSSLGDINKILSIPNLKNYWDLYQTTLVTEQKFGKNLIVINGVARTTKEYVSGRIFPNKQFIFSTAKTFSIDPYLIGAILIDEIARLASFENILEALAIHLVEKNISVGMGQITLETARGLIKTGYYNPNPNDEKLNKQNIGRIPRSYLYQYVIQSKDNINFSAARMRSLMDEWKSKASIDLDNVIVATLYSLPRKIPHGDPKSNSRGEQIASEFYTLAKEILQ